MSGDLDDLARSAAEALVSAMVTDSWEAVKQRFAAIAGHERRMDAARTELDAASAADRSRVQRAQIRTWSTRLRDALDDDTGAVKRLGALLTDLGAHGAAEAAGVQEAHADHEAQAVNVGGHISGNPGGVYVGVGEIDKHTATGPFALVSSAARKVAAHPVPAVAVGPAAAGWSVRWPSARFSATAAPGPMAVIALGKPGALALQPLKGSRQGSWLSPSAMQFSDAAQRESGNAGNTPDFLEPGGPVCVVRTFSGNSDRAYYANANGAEISPGLGERPHWQRYVAFRWRCRPALQYRLTPQVPGDTRSRGLTEVHEAGREYGRGPG